MSNTSVDIAIVGAGLAGIATACYLCSGHNKYRVALIERETPMGFTTAQSGDNYRDWWPSQTMFDFTSYSIDLMEKIALESGNVLNMTRRGYGLATRADNIEGLLGQLHNNYDHAAGSQAAKIRQHTGAQLQAYKPASDGWQQAPGGVDVLSGAAAIRSQFPAFCDDVKHVIHIRRAGDIDGQQLGHYMLQEIKAAGGRIIRGDVAGIVRQNGYTLECVTSQGIQKIRAEKIVNAAGPFAHTIAKMLDVDLPMHNIFQQKVAFEDSLGAVPRHQLFAIDLDAQALEWSDEERELLAGDPDSAWLTQILPGGVHCRPDGGSNGSRVKLGWAYNKIRSEPCTELHNEPQFDTRFPEIVMRGAARLIPALKPYCDWFPGHWTHYGGYYSMTEENWPLIGPLKTVSALNKPSSSSEDGAYIVGALSGFGSMAACAAGKLCADWISNARLPDFARALSLQRYEDAALMRSLQAVTSKGIL